MKRLLALAAVLVALSPAARAVAQPNYPAVVKEHIQAVRKPPCKVCHVDGITGYGTAGTPFARNMKSYGLKAFDEDSVRMALDGLDDFHVDSTKSRKNLSDVDVLRRGGDPNDYDPIYIIDEPQYGCGGATIAARGDAGSNVSFAFGAIGAALALARRWRRHRSPIAQGSARSS